MSIKKRTQWFGLFAGPIAAIIVGLMLPEYCNQDGFCVEVSTSTRMTAAIAIWMAIWWLTEAIAVYATALLPLALFPLFGVADIKQAASAYGHELIYLFLGGFVIALSMQRWGLHRRIAYSALRYTGIRGQYIVGGFMLITALLSMWMSNTATTIMMLPIVVSIIAVADLETASTKGNSARNFSTCLLLGIAYAASIGGVATLIGTPPNLFLASFIFEEYGHEISFVRWMGVGLPIVCILLPLCWWLLTYILYPVRDIHLERIEEQIDSSIELLGPMNKGEKVTLAVFLLTACMWMLRPLLQNWTIDGGGQPFSGLSDAGIAIIAVLILFVYPIDIKERTFVMDWDSTVKLPWGLLVLFGGGLSLAAALRVNGVSEYLGSFALGLSALPQLVIVFFVVVFVVYLTELTSNIATTASLLPVLGAISPVLGISPSLLLVSAAVAASCAFMLPVATPPNAIIFGSGRVSVFDMSRSGLWLNNIAIVVVTGVCYFLVDFVLGDFISF